MEFSSHSSPKCNNNREYESTVLQTSSSCKLNCNSVGAIRASTSPEEQEDLEVPFLGAHSFNGKSSVNPQLEYYQQLASHISSQNRSSCSNPASTMAGSTAMFTQPTPFGALAPQHLLSIASIQKALHAQQVAQQKISRDSHGTVIDCAISMSNHVSPIDESQKTPGHPEMTFDQGLGGQMMLKSILQSGLYGNLLQQGSTSYEAADHCEENGSEPASLLNGHSADQDKMVRPKNEPSPLNNSETNEDNLIGNSTQNTSSVVLLSQDDESNKNYIFVCNLPISLRNGEQICVITQNGEMVSPMVSLMPISDHDKRILFTMDARRAPTPPMSGGLPDLFDGLRPLPKAYIPDHSDSEGRSVLSNASPNVNRQMMVARNLAAVMASSNQNSAQKYGHEFIQSALAAAAMAATTNLYNHQNLSGKVENRSQVPCNGIADGRGTSFVNLDLNSPMICSSLQGKSTNVLGKVSESGAKLVNGSFNLTADRVKIKVEKSRRDKLNKLCSNHSMTSYSMGIAASKSVDTVAADRFQFDLFDSKSPSNDETPDFTFSDEGSSEMTISQHISSAKYNNKLNGMTSSKFELGELDTLNNIDGINLEEIKEFAKMFKMKRLSLGLTQTQVGQALSLREGPAYSQSAICRFEKLDITPKSAQKIKPVLEKWMKEVDEKFQQNQLSGVYQGTFNQPGPSSLSSHLHESSKKRKRRTSFTPQALDLLNEYFEKNTHPTGAEMTALAESLNYDREVVRVWFCNKRQALKNTIKKLKQTD